jgi:outer membrane protein TolC
MNSTARTCLNVSVFVSGFLLLPRLVLLAQDSSSVVRTNQAQLSGPYPINLATALKLVNARNLDVQIAQQKLAEAKAVSESAELQFFPWLLPGIGYQRHDNLIQDVSGSIIEVHKQSYTPGATFKAQVDLGAAIYNSLAARQKVHASDHGVEVERQNSGLAAAVRYYDLLQAQAGVGVAQDARRISQEYERQLKSAVEAGLAYKGDQLRVQVQTGQTDLALRQTQERQRVAAARLAETLYLDPAVELVGDEKELVPMSLIDRNATLGALIETALVKRPELQRSHALIEAAHSAKQGAVVGPLIPSLGGQAYLGGLGGGIDNTPGRFGQSEDYAAYLSWRIGPGGLFDYGRKHQAKAQLETARLEDEKLRTEIAREVVESLTRFHSLADQLSTTKQTLAAAIEAQKLAEQRKEFAIGAVLEDIQTQQDFTRAQNDYVNAVGEYNKAGFSLSRAIGGLYEVDKNQTDSLSPR